MKVELLCIPGLQITSSDEFQFVEHLNKRTNDLLPLKEETRQMIEDIQWADRKLYNAVLEMRKLRQQ